MPATDVVNVTALLAPPPIGVAGFATPLIAATLTSDQLTAWNTATSSARTHVVTPSTWQDFMETLEVTSTERLYIMLRRLFGQDLRPSRVMIGRRATPVAQVVTVSIDATPADGTYIVTINGEAFTFTASSNTQTEVANGLRALINPGAQPVTGSGTTSLILTADEAGVPFTVALSGTGDPMTSSVTTANVGMPEDLDDFNDEDPDFYIVGCTSRTTGNILATFDACSSMERPRFPIMQTDDADAQTSGEDADVGSQLVALAHRRGIIVYHDDDDEPVDACLIGRMAPTSPASATFANRELAGVVGIVPTDSATLRSKRYTWLESFRAGSFSMTQGGRVPHGEPAHEVIGLDYLVDLVQARILDKLRAVAKVPYTDEGARELGEVLRSAARQVARDPHTLIVESTIEVEVPLVSSQDADDRDEGIMRNFVISAVRTGSVERVYVSITLALAG